MPKYYLDMMVPAHLVRHRHEEWVFRTALDWKQAVGENGWRVSQDFGEIGGIDLSRAQQTGKVEAQSCKAGSQAHSQQATTDITFQGLFRAELDQRSPPEEEADIVGADVIDGDDDHGADVENHASGEQGLVDHVHWYHSQ